MSDTLSGILGFLMIAGLFVAYARQRRERNRVRKSPVVSEPQPVVGSAAESEQTTGSRSPNWGMPIAYCSLLAGAASLRGSMWGYLWSALFFALIGVAAYTTFSPSEFAVTQLREPERTRRDHYIVVGVPYLLFPLAGWVLAVPVRWPFGVFVPALPWLAMLVIAAVVAIRAHT